MTNLDFPNLRLLVKKISRKIILSPVDIQKSMIILFGPCFFGILVKPVVKSIKACSFQFFMQVK